MKEFIICVDENDKKIGVEEKIKVHKEGILHRAFSIFIFNDKKELLLQRRALEKYHSLGLWTNTCCSHQRENETLKEAALRRIEEEMGFKCELNESFVFSYKVRFDDGLIENEIDHVFIGTYTGKIFINKDEVKEYKWITIEEVIKDIELNPQKYTYWFKDIINKYAENIFAV
ncbi:isopentenyl-diphosphate Delta-isomerase [Clostridium celatum]|uniref:isopentenyl-diphosphate Delta-isomerase n=1 Tax=Clostridium celatum TaxID=36834 RepID=UPI00290C3469|nr:isopentenyl-diphosphate Delta-isomerase [Clostridium celatum]MDU6295608.1 isopentenyl-diphosphate Delta-isomerase [Clostridium celatum]